MKANFVGGPNPVPVKAALALMGLCTDMVRMPLLPLDEPHVARLRWCSRRPALGWARPHPPETRLHRPRATPPTAAAGSKRSTSHLAVVPPTVAARS